MDNSRNRELENLFKQYDSLLRNAQLHKGDPSAAEQTANMNLSEEEYGFIIEKYLENENVSFALHSAEEAFGKFPYSGEMLTLYCDVLIIDNQLSKAEELLNQFSLSSGMTPDIAIGYSRIFIRKGDMKSAMEYYRKAIELEAFPEDLCDSVHILAQDCAERLYYKEAIELLQDAFDLTMKWHIQQMQEISKEDLMKFDMEFAFCHERLGEYEKSAEYYNKCIDADPFDDMIWVRLGQVYCDSEKFEKAREAFEYAASLNKENAEALFKLGVVNMIMLDHNDAIDNLEKYCNLNKTDVTGLTALASAHISASHYKEAMLLFHRALALEPKNKNALDGISMLERLAKEKKAAKGSKGNTKKR